MKKSMVVRKGKKKTAKKRSGSGPSKTVDILGGLTPEESTEVLCLYRAREFDGKALLAWAEEFPEEDALLLRRGTHPGDAKASEEENRGAPRRGSGG